jgi:hypothetical protein
MDRAQALKTQTEIVVSLQQIGEAIRDSERFELLDMAKELTATTAFWRSQCPPIPLFIDPRDPALTPL